MIQSGGAIIVGSCSKNTSDLSFSGRYALTLSLHRFNYPGDMMACFVVGVAGDVVGVCNIFNFNILFISLEAKNSNNAMSNRDLRPQAVHIRKLQVCCL